MLRVLEEKSKIYIDIYNATQDPGELTINTTYSLNENIIKQTNRDYILSLDSDKLRKINSANEQYVKSNFPYLKLASISKSSEKSVKITSSEDVEHTPDRAGFYAIEDISKPVYGDNQYGFNVTKNFDIYYVYSINYKLARYINRVEPVTEEPISNQRILSIKYAALDNIGRNDDFYKDYTVVFPWGIRDNPMFITTPNTDDMFISISTSDSDLGEWSLEHPKAQTYKYSYQVELVVKDIKLDDTNRDDFKAYMVMLDGDLLVDVLAGYGSILESIVIHGSDIADDINIEPDNIDKLIYSQTLGIFKTLANNQQVKTYNISLNNTVELTFGTFSPNLDTVKLCDITRLNLA